MTCVRCKSNINVSTDRYWTNWGDIFCSKSCKANHMAKIPLTPKYIKPVKQKDKLCKDM